MNKIKIFLCFLFVSVFFSSCGEYYQVLKSTNPNDRYSYAKKCYNEKQYSRVIDLMSDVVSAFAGTSEGPQSTYILANSYYELGDNDEASTLFKNYYTSYPKAKHAEEARFKAGECLYRDVPDPRLDQSPTYKAIQYLQSYLDYYPKGKYYNQVSDMLFALQDRLAEKQYLAAKLYYNLGLYLGNNYLSCVITAKDALKTYPYTKWKEDLMFLILQAEYQEALNSVPQKFQARVRDVIDQYYNYINEYPQGKYAQKAKTIYQKMDQYVEKYNK